jgi:putative copper resistance protein D
MNLLTTAFKFLNLIGGFAVVGALLSMAFLVVNKDGFLTTSGEKVRSFLKVSSTIWVVGAFGTVIFTLAQILGTTVSDALDLTVIRSFITQISLGKYLAFQALIAAVVFI